MQVTITPKTIRNWVLAVAGTVGALLTIRKGYDAVKEDFFLRQKIEMQARIDEKSYFVRQYGQTAEAHVINDGIVKQGHEVTVRYDKIMKLPPNGGYWFHAYIGDENGNVIANSGGNRNPDGVWSSRFYADSWTDFSTVTFQGNGFRVPERLKPGNYTVVCILEVSTPDGIFTGWLNPIPFTLVENEQKKETVQ